MANTKKPVKKVVKKTETKSTRNTKNSKSRENKLHIYAGFILGLLTAILFFEIYLVVYTLCA